MTRPQKGQDPRISFQDSGAGLEHPAMFGCRVQGLGFKAWGRSFRFAGDGSAAKTVSPIHSAQHLEGQRDGVSM